MSEALPREAVSPPSTGHTPLQPQPTRPEARATLIDALRGFALFGVCLGNLSVAFAFWDYPGTAELTPAWRLATDETAAFLYHALVDGKFYSIFSLLFGLGFALQLMRRTDEALALRLYRRRLRILMVIGGVHLALFWTGDILFFYAVMGLIMFRMRGLDDARLLRWIVLLTFLPVVFYLPLLLSPVVTLAAPFWIIGTGVAELLGYTGNTPTFMYDHLGNGGWLEFFQINFGGIWWRFADLTFTGRPFKVLAMFLLGMVIGRHRPWEQIEPHLPLLRRTLGWGLALGLPASLALAAVSNQDAYYSGTWHGVLESALYAVGVIPLALAYTAGFVLLWQRAAWQRVLVWLAPTGRMALTNYLMQTLIGITIFYGIGFGLAGRVGATWLAPLALAILVVQTIFSQWWLARFRFGPMEWLWRSWTYGSWQGMKMSRES